MRVDGPRKDGIVEDDLVLVNRQGLHARPSQLVVRTASAFSSRILLSRDGIEVDGKSIMGVMMLAAEKGAVLHVRAEGADAPEAVAALKDLFASGFGEEV
jgi:phosphocarrier protein